MRSLLLSVGWLTAGAAQYGSLLLLDVYWNLVRWHPAWDAAAWALIAGNLAAEVSIAALARVSRDRVSRVVSVILCSFLLGLGAWACAPEPLRTGLFERESPSPLWYRGGRLVAMGLPLVIWIRTRKGQSGR
jgi:hypothetical protein